MWYWHGDVSRRVPIPPWMCVDILLRSHELLANMSIGPRSFLNNDVIGSEHHLCSLQLWSYPVHSTTTAERS